MRYFTAIYGNGSDSSFSHEEKTTATDNNKNAKANNDKILCFIL